MGCRRLESQAGRGRRGKKQTFPPAKKDGLFAGEAMLQSVEGGFSDGGRLTHSLGPIPKASRLGQISRQVRKRLILVSTVPRWTARRSDPSLGLRWETQFKGRAAASFRFKDDPFPTLENSSPEGCYSFSFVKNESSAQRPIRVLDQVHLCLPVLWISDCACDHPVSRFHGNGSSSRNLGGGFDFNQHLRSKGW